MSARTHTVVRDRIHVFDGLRGIGIVLVLLSHTAWLTWPHVRGEGSRLVRTALENGNYAVSIFFVVGAFLYTRSLLARAATPGGLHPGVQLVRRYLRLTPGVLVLLAVAALVVRFEPKVTYPGLELWDSARPVLTYTWNWYVKDNPVDARADLGHLWYLSVDMQAFLLVMLLVYFLHHRPWWLISTLAAVLVMVLMWRTHVYQSEGIYQALLRTNARLDAPLSGALAACLLPYLRRFSRWAPHAAIGSLAVTVALAFVMYEDVAYFRVPGALLDVSLAAFLVACTIAPVPALLARTLGFAPLAALGRRSLSAYIWHFPIYMYLYHHTDSWSWQWRTAAAFGLTLAIAFVTDRTIEHWVGRALIDPRWTRLDHGTPAYLVSRLPEPARRVLRPPAPADVSADAAGAPEPAPSAPSRPTHPSDA